MGGGKVACRSDFDQRIRERAPYGLAVRSDPSEQARAGHRRERHRNLKFWVVAPACTFESFRPAMVEDVFSAGVHLDVAGSNCQEIARDVLSEQVSRLPTGSTAHGS